MDQKSEDNDAECVLVVGGFTLAQAAVCDLLNVETQEWRKVTEMSHLPLVSNHGLVRTDEKHIFVVGGYNSEEKAYSRSHYCLNLENYKWIEKTPMENARRFVSAVSCCGKIYVMGGFNGYSRHSSVESYEPESDKWTTEKPMLMSRSDAAAVVIDTNKIMVVGGTDGHHAMSSTEIYDTEAKEWTFGPSLHVARSSHAAVFCNNGYAYVLGGHDKDNNVIDSVEILDTSTLDSSWTPGAAMIQARSSFAAVPLSNNSIMAICGYDGYDDLASTEIYKEESQTWSAGPAVSSPKSCIAAVKVQKTTFSSMFRE